MLLGYLQWQSKQHFRDFKTEFAEVVQFIYRNDRVEKEYDFIKLEIKRKNKVIQAFWRTLPKTSRIIAVCEIVPNILEKYIQLFVQKMPHILIVQLTMSIFHRFSHLFEHDTFKERIKDLLLKNLEKNFRMIPDLVFILHTEIISKISNFLEPENWDLVLTLCWSIGEFMQSDHPKDVPSDYNKLERAHKFADSLEVIVFEILKYYKDNGIEVKLSDPLDLYFTKLIQIVINSLTKLAVKFKEFIPKVVLLFTKILANKDIFLKNIGQRVKENLALLKYTSISTILFTDAPEEEEDNEYVQQFHISALQNLSLIHI
eukprot:TRINITY_DN11545_c0_g1_i2.p1 TRINITY_DN11545_c0_g1~~TRINITY_DN11545_c0_g1_i2.p1  ORF type:complete len:316 (-),score=36.07 TRINITY_DN11545_c0_g1_i2:62-1009(-)